MIAVDTNVLIYAHRLESQWHPPAYRKLTELVESGNVWTIFWPCVHEFLAIATHARIFNTPTSVEQAVGQVEAWLDSPGFVAVTEAEGYWPWLKLMVEQGRITGPRMHDARLAALCKQHDVLEFWTADRDFSRFPDLPARNPLVG